MHNSIFVSIALAFILQVNAAELENCNLKAESLPAGIRMEARYLAPFMHGKNPALLTEEEDVKAFSKSFEVQRDKLAGIKAISFLLLRQVNELGVIGHEFRHPPTKDEIEELKKSYEPLIAHVKYVRFIQAGTILAVLWSKNEYSEEVFNALDATLRKQLGIEENRAK